MLEQNLDLQYIVASCSQPPFEESWIVFFGTETVLGGSSGGNMNFQTSKHA